jgi:hypothetical protein
LPRPEGALAAAFGVQRLYWNAVRRLLGAIA